jgi:hypothetical protein
MNFIGVLAGGIAAAYALAEFLSAAIHYVLVDPRLGS